MHGFDIISTWEEPSDFPEENVVLENVVHRIQQSQQLGEVHSEAENAPRAGVASCHFPSCIYIKACGLQGLNEIRRVPKVVNIMFAGEASADSSAYISYLYFNARLVLKRQQFPLLELWLCNL